MCNYIQKVITIIVKTLYISRCFHKKKKDVSENDTVGGEQFLEIEELNNHNRDKTS